MMNVVGLLLVTSSLVTAGFWSPKDHENVVNNGIKNGENVIVKEGHRVVVVEYDPDTDGNTKVLISPQDHHAKETLSSVTDNVKEKAKETFEEAKEKAKEAASVLPNLGQGSSRPSEPNSRGPRELVCDAFGKCKHKITSAMEKAKDKASESVHEVSEKVHSVEEQAKEKVSEAIEKTKDTISCKTDEISSRAHEAKQRAGETVKEAVDTSKTIGHDVAKNVSSKIGEARERGKREMGEISLWVRGLAKHAWGYVMGVVHLLGFATAYGMCIWVTFISSYVLAGALPRQQFGIVQSKVYPVYFRMLAYCVMVTLVGHLFEQRKNLFSRSVGMAQACSLLCSIAMILFNLLYLEPCATKAMFVRMKLEKEEGRGHDNLDSETTARVTDHHISSTSTPSQSRAQEKIENTNATTKAQIMKLGETLKKLNAYSSFLNILTLMALTAHLVYLGQRLRVTC